jgi:hypothetical protein
MHVGGLQSGLDHMTSKYAMVIYRQADPAVLCWLGNLNVF